jgi:two-component system, NtrC family, sensor histidine kinase HydH
MRRVAVLAMFATIAAAQRFTPHDRANLQSILSCLYYFPVTIAALYDGWRGGLLVAALAAAALWQAPVVRYPEIASLVAIALLIGFYTDHERRQKSKYQELAGELSGVYEKLQTNFEGMKRAERLSAIGQLSAGLAHEIRNPLASIAGAASILRRNQQLDAKASKCVDIIDSECKRLNGLLTTFLNFARPRPPRLQTVHLDTILDSVIELAQHAIGRKRIDFRRSIASDLPSIECDSEQMTQVLLNLVINATEASAEGSVVTLAAERADDATNIRVIDEGSGVATEDVDKLFDPFFTTKETGTGLGLPVAHQIVGQMGGSLTAHRNPGRGMTFSIAFPLKRTHTHV